jgi:capsular polysaccharide transport system permease protein
MADATIDLRLSAIEMLKAEGRIMHALMLRIIKSRLGGNEFGFVVMGIGWPLSHILLLLIINTALGRATPYGDSAALWFATGIVPFIAFQYMARFIMVGTVVNRALFSFPVVKVADFVFAAAIVEVLNAGLVVMIVGAIFWAFGIDFMPRDVVQAGLAMLAMMLLGLAWGVIGAVAGAVAPGLMMPFFLFQIVMWISSGILFVPDALPEAIRTPLSYLPYLQGVEWMRSAYYDGFGAAVLDKTYMLSFTVVLLFVGLALERLIRGRLLLQ